jgi:hypothetical protein
MEQRTEPPPRAAGKFEPCGKGGCKHGWVASSGRPCACYATHLNQAVTECLRRAQEQPR